MIFRYAVIFVCILFPAGFAQNPGDVVFAGNKVHSINLIFQQPNFWDSLTYYYSLGTEQYMMASAEVNGILIDSVGVRLKGNSSYTHPNNKKSLRVDFGRYVSGGRWDGLKSIHLNNVWGDPTFMREKLFLDFCKDAGIHAPRANYAEVKLNNTGWGLYSLVEPVDSRFLNAHFGTATGNQYKAADGIGAAAQYISDFLWYGSDIEQYKLRYELSSDSNATSYSDLILLIDSLNRSSNSPASTAGMLNLASMYGNIAADILFSSLDSYAGSGRNFYIYNSPVDNRFNWITWDAGLSFGAYAGGVTNFESLSLLYVSNGANRPLLQKIYADPLQKQLYLSTLCGLARDYFNVQQLSAKIDTLSVLLRPYVYADSRKMFTNQQFELNIFSDITISGNQRVPGLKSFLSQRSASVQNQLSSLGISCAVTLNPGDIVINEFAADNDSIPDPAGEFEDWVEIYNNTSAPVNMSGFYLSDNYTVPQKWQFPENTVIQAGGYLVVWADEDSGQAGLHASFKLSQSGERLILSDQSLTTLDSISFGAQSTNITSARNPNGTGAFVPSLPTPGFGNVPVARSIVINEFAASNDSITDPAGEFEDWIELYNTTGSPVNLGGFYLSDNFTLPQKWQFPENTIIEPHGFLIVWADEDSGQVGLHASFRLSQSGERIMLSNSLAEILDSVSFGQQTTNITMSRVPDGSGGFMFTPPTPGFANYISSVEEEEYYPEEFALFNNFPNPFNPSTEIRYSVPAGAMVSLKIYDILGKLIAVLADEYHLPGLYSKQFNAEGLSSGMYFYRMTTPLFSVTKSMLLIK